MEGDESITFETDRIFDPEAYLHFYGNWLTPERTRKEADFVEDVCDLRAGARLLDLACGNGRITNELAERGYRTVGLDLTWGLLAIARDDTPREGTYPEYVQGDMRDLPYDDGTFDAAVSVHTSVGYFDKAGNERTFEELARVLRPGGYVLIDTIDRDGIVSDFRQTPVWEVDDGDYLVHQNEFDSRRGRLDTDVVMIRKGTVEKASQSIRTYSYTELASILSETGFEVEAGYGNMDGDEYSRDTTRLCLIARRRSG
jgi:SAM-dependent methyltransferase